MSIELVITILVLAVIMCVAVILSLIVSLQVVKNMVRYNNELHDRLMARSLGEFANKKIVDKYVDNKDKKGDVKAEDFDEKVGENEVL